MDISKIPQIPENWKVVEEALHIEPFDIDALSLVPQTLDGSILVMEMSELTTHAYLTHQDIDNLITYLSYWRKVLQDKGVWDANS